MQIYMPGYSYSHIIIASNFSGTNNSTINIRIIFQMKICKGFTSVAAWVEYAFYQIFKKHSQRLLHQFMPSLTVRIS